jgi:hypothetical protein
MSARTDPKNRTRAIRAVFCIGWILGGCFDTAGGQAFEGITQPSHLEGAGGAGVVVAWNELAYEIAYAEDQFLTFKGQRALALINLAMHDALNTITPTYERYAYSGDTRDADPEHAAAYASYTVLRALYPAAVTRLDSAIAQHPKRASNVSASAIEVGSEAGEAVLRMRHADGWDTPGSYVFDEGRGEYQTTPDWRGFVLQPGFRYAKPFALRAPDAFRPAPPPPLSSMQYARAYDEVRKFGAVASIDRSADQAAYAIWWLEFAEGSINRLARRLAVERSLGLWEAARMFAHLHIALYDGYIATWDAKYEYNHWRPFTAIRNSNDGNRNTVPDPQWESLLPAPPFPEYVSAHATACSAAFTVLASVWPDAQSFTMTTITAPPEMRERTFSDFRSAAAECADSRVRLGWHFRYSTDAGLQLGERVARHVLRAKLRAKRS